LSGAYIAERFADKLKLHSLLCNAHYFQQLHLSKKY